MLISYPEEFKSSKICMGFNKDIKIDVNYFIYCATHIQVYCAVYANFLEVRRTSW